VWSSLLGHRAKKGSNLIAAEDGAQDYTASTAKAAIKAFMSEHHKADAFLTVGESHLHLLKGDC
jgi:hypothetical protein